MQDFSAIEAAEEADFRKDIYSFECGGSTVSYHHLCKKELSWYTPEHKRIEHFIYEAKSLYYFEITFKKDRKTFKLPSLKALSAEAVTKQQFIATYSKSLFLIDKLNSLPFPRDYSLAASLNRQALALLRRSVDQVLEEVFKMFNKDLS